MTMLAALSDIPTVARVIQLAVAPVFLLTGIGAILGVLANRLARIVDRSRRLYDLDGAKRAAAEAEIGILWSRARWIHWAITLCTLSALSICMSIASLFIGVELQVDLPGAVSLLFVAAMLALILGLICFLREITLATGVLEKPQQRSP